MTVRISWTVVGVVMWLGAAPVVWAQGTAPDMVMACIPCHRAAVPATPGVPPLPRLDGQQAAYLDKQLREYKSGKRKGAVMPALIRTLKPQQLSVMAAHFASQAPAQGAVESPELAARGKAIYEEGNRASGVPGCVGCHLPEGVGHQRYPRLAGQLQAYVVQQLLEFKSGARSNDRAHVMRAVAARLTDEEIKAVAEYVAGLR
jgi:cytochrome c553